MENIEKIDINILNETIEDLKNNTESCKLSNVDNNIDNIITIPNSLPGEKLMKFMEYIEKVDLYDKNYFENSKNMLPDSEIQSFTFENCMTRFTYAIRADRFSSGSLYSDVKSGLILKLLLRIREIKTGIKEEYQTMDYIENMVNDINNMEYNEKFTLNQLFKKYSLVDTSLDNKFDIIDELFDKLKERNIIVKSITNENQNIEPFEFDCIKLKPKKLLLKIEHTPFYSCYGLKEEIEKNIPEPEINYYELNELSLIRNGNVNIEIKKVDYDYIKFLLFNANTFFINNAKTFNEENSIIDLYLNNSVNITLDVCDAMETWILTLVEKDV